MYTNMALVYWDTSKIDVISTVIQWNILRVKGFKDSVYKSHLFLILMFMQYTTHKFNYLSGKISFKTEARKRNISFQNYPKFKINIS